MSDLTVTDLKEKLIHELDLARERVKTLEDQLKWINDAISGSSESTEEKKSEQITNTEQTSLFIEPESSDPTSLTAAIKDLMMNAPGQFNVPGIIKAVSKNFPELERKEISKRASQIANRLRKSNKIKLVEKGEGRGPNTYTSAKYS